MGLFKGLFNKERLQKPCVKFDIVFIKAHDGKIIGGKVYQLQVYLGNTTILPDFIFLEKEPPFFPGVVIDLIENEPPKVLIQPGNAF